MNIVINGGTGWLGIATLRALERIKYIENIEITSSNGRTFIAHDLGEFKTKKLTNNTKIDFKTDILVNLAFKTRDYISILGEEEYTKINLEILKSSVNLAKHLEPKSIVIVSSGVVSRNLDSQGRLDNTQYTKLKNLEEETFTAIHHITEISHQLGHSISNVSLAWLAHQFGVSSMMVGARNPQQLLNNLSFTTCQLTKSANEALNYCTLDLKTKLGANLDPYESEEYSRIY